MDDTPTNPGPSIDDGCLEAGTCSSDFQLETSVLGEQPTKTVGLQQPPLNGPASTTSSLPGDNGGPVESAQTSGTPQSSALNPTQSEPKATSGATSVEPVAATSTATSNNGGSGLNPGAVAGIAIATLIIGAAVAFVAAFFLFKRRNRKRDANIDPKAYTNYADSTPELVMMQKSVGHGGMNSPYVQVSQTPMPAPAATSMPAPAPVQHSNPSIVASFLPPAAHEDAIQSRVSALFSLIHSHVETYYRDVHASITPSMEPELAKFGAEDVNMAELLQDCSSPTIALKHALVAYVLGITSPRKEQGGETIFPKGLSGIPMEDCPAHTSVSESDLAAATALHRRLSVYLWEATEGTSNSHRSWFFDSDTHEAADHFSATFFPWANPTSSEQDRDEYLAGIISQALKLRIWLFGQPSSYDFKWEGTGNRGVQVSPGLIRRTYERGESDERRVLEGVVIPI